MDLRKISDKDLLSKTKELVSRERELLTEILRHLREIERRRLFSDLGYSSLFDYCLKGLGYSEAETKYRIDAMRLIRELPQIEEHVTSGELSLTNLVQAKSFFRAEEKSGPMGTKEKLEIIDSLKNKSSREGEKILLAQSTIEPAPVKEKIRQVTAEVAEVKFAADDELLAKITRLRGLLAHKNPNMKTSELINELCEIALDRLDPIRKKTRTEKKSENLPNFIRRAPDVKNVARQYISVKTKKEVWQKSGGKCANCHSEFALENDHVVPVALGGSSEISNLRVLCRNCNQRAAIAKLGQDTMDKYLT
jgi:hypothetical protein